MHCPPTHLWSTGQALPHLPQWALSVFGSVQTPSHRFNPPLHLHIPLLQISALEQVRPQPPQLLALVLVSTQLPPHRVRLLSQFRTHFDCEQT